MNMLESCSMINIRPPKAGTCLNKPRRFMFIGRCVNTPPVMSFCEEHWQKRGHMYDDPMISKEEALAYILTSKYPRIFYHA